MGKLTLKSKHRVLCGDCTVKENVDRLMQGEKADMVFTDIPYNISQESNGIRNIHYGEWDTGIGSEIGIEAIDICNKVSIGIFYFFCSHEQLSEMLVKMEDTGRSTRLFAWIKPNPNVMNGDKIWLNAIECCAYGKPANGTHNVNCERGVYEGAAPTRREHPTQKPVELIEKCVRASSNEKESVLDPFLGSGSTLIACEKTNRRCFGCEIEPLYIDTILDRWSTYTDKIPIREDGVSWHDLKFKSMQK